MAELVKRPFWSGSMSAILCGLVACQILLTILPFARFVGVTVLVGTATVNAAALLLIYLAAINAAARGGRYPALLQGTPPTDDREVALSGLRMIRRDPLTNLGNRCRFEEILSASMAGSGFCAILLLNIDGFRRINTRFGFAAGDLILQQVGDRLRIAMPGANAVTHICSDDFAILVDDVTQDIEAIALQLLRAFDTPFRCDDGEPKLTASVGIALAPKHGRTADVALKAAHHALRRAKRAGAGRWGNYNSSVPNTRQALRAACVSGQIIPFYQPIVEIASGDVVGMEVLARWNHPVEGILPPSAFIDAADDNDLLGELTCQLLLCVARDTESWPSSLFFAFNIASSQLPELCAIGDKIAGLARLPAARIVFELTERAPVDDIAATTAQVGSLRGHGMRVALADFGACNGNFHHLRRIAFDTLKIHRAFVLDMLTDSRAELCVRSICSGAALLGVDVSAEGVGTPEVAAKLARLGCRFAQGSLYSMPVPSSEVPDVLRRLGAIPVPAARVLGHEQLADPLRRRTARSCQNAAGA